MDVPFEEIGRCRLESKLGQGGMGVVYKGHHLDLDLPVAVKLLPMHLAERPEAAERFLREARLTARLNHPEIVRVFSCGKEHDHHYLVMEFVDGQNVQDLINAEGTLSVERTLEIGKAVCRALSAGLSQEGIIHRDIKPENIMVTRDGKIKVADMGLAKVISDAGTGPGVTATGMGMGTPSYMSPEQFMDASSVDHRADMFSLGTTLYHMLSGQRPFEGDTVYEILVRVREKQPDPLPDHVPDAVKRMIAKMMAKEPGDRYQTYEELMVAMEQAEKAPAGAQTMIDTGETLPQGPMSAPTPGTIPNVTPTTTPTPAPADSGKQPTSGTILYDPAERRPGGKGLIVAIAVGVVLVVAMVLAIGIGLLGLGGDETNVLVEAKLASARTLHDKGMLEEAERKLSEALFLAPDHAQALKDLRAIRAEIKNRHAESKREEVFGNLMHEARKLKRAGRLKEAAEAYQEAAEYGGERKDEAIEAGKRCLHDFYRGRGDEARQGDGDLPRAIEMYKKALEQVADPHTQQALNAAERDRQIARLMEKARDAEAQRQWKKAIGLYGELDKLGADVAKNLRAAELELKLETLLATARRQVKQAAWPKALKTIQEIERLRPNEPAVASLLAAIRTRSLPARRTAPLGVDLVFVPGGAFRMGSASESEHERPVHTVTVSGFYMARHEVTRAQYAAFRAGKRRAAGPRSPADREPVVDVSWEDAKAFCDYLTKIDPAGVRYRLPTEAEWEYAARDARGATYPWGDEEPTARHANLAGADRFARLAPVGSFPRGATRYGIFDLIGNAAEWCADWSGHYTARAATDPTGPTRGTKRVMRGSAFAYSARMWSRATTRVFAPPNQRSDKIGFRVVAVLSDELKKAERMTRRE